MKSGGGGAASVTMAERALLLSLSRAVTWDVPSDLGFLICGRR